MPPQEGDIVVNRRTGERAIVRNGVPVPLENSPAPAAPAAPAVPARSGPPAFIPGVPKAPSQPNPYEVEQDEIKNERNAQNDQFGNTMDLRKQFDSMPLVKSYRVALPQYVQGLNTENTPQGDLALIYAYAKVMDPDSVVREGEAASVANADTLAGKTVARLMKELQGTGTFSPQARANLRREMQGKVAELNRAYNSNRQRYEADARAFGLDPERILGPHDGALFFDRIKNYWESQGGDGSSAIPGVRAPNMIGDVPEGTEVELGMDKWGRNDVFDRESYLRDTYNLGPNEEATIIGFWNANRGNQSLTPEGAAQWYEQNGFALPTSDDLSRMVADAQRGANFGGIDTSAAESAYKARLDKVLEERGSDPESVTGTIGAKAAQGITWGGLDELAGFGGAINAAMRGQNPIAGYQVERDVLRREQERAGEANPILSTASELAGGVFSGGAGFRNVRTVADAGKAGALTGGAAGFNYGEGLGGSTVGAFTGAVGGAGLGATAQAVVPRVASAFSSKMENFTPRRVEVDPAAAQSLAEAGERVGVPVRQVDVRPDLRAKRSQILSTDNGGKIVRDAADEDLAAFEAALDKLGGGRIAPDRFGVGDAMQEALSSRRAQTGKRGSALYTRAEKLAGDAKVIPSNALKAIDNQIAELEASGPNANRELIGYLNEVKSDLSREGGLGVTALRDQRTNLRGQINAKGLSQTDAERRVGLVLDAAADDIKAGLSGNPRALDAFRTADDYWRTRAQFIKQIEGKLVGSPDNPVSAETTASRITGWLRNDSKRFRRLWTELPEENRQDIAAHVASNLGRNTKGEFSLDWFLRHTGGKGALIDRKAGQLIFGENGMRALDDLRAIARAKVGAVSETNTSRTATALGRANSGLRSAILGFFGFTGGGPVGGVALPIAADVMAKFGERRAARMLINPDFTKWLRNLPETADPARINRYFNRLSNVGARNPAIQQDINAFVRTLMEAANDNVGVRASAGDSEKEQAE